MISYAMAMRNRRELSRRWPEHNRRRGEDGGWEKLCGCCQEWLPLDSEFFVFIPKRGYFQSYCKFCEAEQRRERRQRNTWKATESEVA